MRRHCALAAVLVLVTTGSPAVVAAATRVAILEFEGAAGGGRKMADAVETELELVDGVVLVPRSKVAAKLRRGSARLSAPSVASAMQSGNVDLALVGVGRQTPDGPAIELTAYNRQGKIVWSEIMTLSSDEPDPDTIAPQIADGIKSAIADGLQAREGGGRMPVATVSRELADDDLAPEADGLPDGENDRSKRPTADRDRSETAKPKARELTAIADREPERRRLDDEEDWDRPVAKKDDAADQDKQRISDIDQQQGKPGARSGVRAQIPYIAASLAFEPLYWSYSLTAEAGNSEVKWSPLSPFAGGSLRLESWPILYAGVDAQARFGKVQVDLSQIPGLTAKAIEVYFYELQLHVRGRYVLEVGWPGFAAGARLGYRYLRADAARQDPFTVVPGYDAHILSPGIEVRLPFHPQYAVLDLTAEVVPFAVYAETPDEPGRPGTASVLGWRVDGIFHSTIMFGIFAELRLFYEELYVTYSDTGTRTNVSGEEKFAEGKVTTGLRGLSIGIGWAY